MHMRCICTAGPCMRQAACVISQGLCTLQGQHIMTNEGSKRLHALIIETYALLPACHPVQLSVPYKTCCRNGQSPPS